MKAVVLLRTASVMTFVFALLHTKGMPWTPALGPGEVPIVEGMKTHAFDVMGVTRTYFSFYEGFGLLLSIMLLTLAVLIWMMATLVKAGVSGMRPMIAATAGAFAANAVLTWEYIFPVPALFAIVIGACLVLAIVFMRPATRPTST